MARTLKRFETEAEFEAWKNSPDMRTPYTCLVTETGAVHYDEGSDDDYSITFVVRKNGWIRLWGPSIYKVGVDGNGFDPQVYVNGVRVESNDKRWEGWGHYRGFFKKDRNQNVILDDYRYSAQIVDKGFESSLERDAEIVENVYGELNQLMQAQHKFSHKRYPQKRHIFLKKGDICKIVVSRQYIKLRKIGNSNSNDPNRPIINYHIFDIVDILRKGDWAEEIIIGDGFDKTPKIRRIKKIFVGKKIKRIQNLVGKDARKSKIYSRTKLENASQYVFAKNVYNDIY